MKKLIIKTSILAILLFMVKFFIFFVVLALFFPSILADTAFRINSKNLCLKYSQAQYEKSLEIDDLALLTERTIWAEDYELTIKYSQLLLNDSDFNCYSKDKDGYENYIASSYTQALYFTNEKAKSIEVAFSYYTGESKPNPIRVLVFLSKDDKNTLNIILQKLENLQTHTTDTTNLITQITKTINIDIKE